jgi:opine dehydrogenase
LQLVTTSLDEAIDGAEAIVVILPATAHEGVARALARRGASVPLILNPGHMCGSLHFRRAFEAERRTCSIVELGTLTYVSRISSPGTVDVYLRAALVPFTTVPADDRLAQLVDDMFPGQARATHPMEPWFWDVNMVLHPPGMVLGAARIEATGGDFTYYREGMTHSVEAVMRSLDEERTAIARAFGVEVPALADAMARLGTADPKPAAVGDLGSAIRNGEANAAIKAPDRLDHRYLHEDVAYGLVPLVALGRIARVAAPVADALITLAEAITGNSYRDGGLNENALGIRGAGRDDLIALARGDV